MTFKPPKPAQQPEPRPDVEVGDHLYVHHQGQPCTGVVRAHGRHGVTVEVDGQHHKVKWDKVLGHKKRAAQRYNVVDQGEDGMLVEDDQGRRRFIGVPNESKEDPMVAKSFSGRRPVLLFMKAAGVAPGPGLAKKVITDKNGVQTSRWVSTAADGPPAQRGQHVGFENGEHRGHGQVAAVGQHGVTVKDQAGGEHRVHHEKITHHWQGEGAPTESPHGDELEQAAAETEARRGHAKKLAEGKDSVELKHPDGKRYALAGKDASKPGGYRITHFDEKGPIGHGERASLEDAVHSGLESGYQPVEQPAPDGAMFRPDEIAALPDKVNQPAKSWDELVEKGTEGLGQFKELMGKVQQVMGLKSGMKPEDVTPEQWENDDGFLFVAPLKGAKRAKEKCEADYGGDWSQLRDIVRGTISVPTMAHVKQAIGHMKTAGLELAQKPKNRFEKPTPEGYRDLMTFVKLPNGMLAELQIHVKSMTLAKEKGHKDYEITRTMQGKYGEPEPTDKWSEQDHTEFYAAVKRQKDIYDAAWQKSNGNPPKQLIKSEQRTTIQLLFRRGSK